jgi:acetyl-CoA carboxylase biotin carboxyl carrier protein
MDRSAEIGELIALIDRLEALLEGSSLSEIEVAAGETILRLRKPVVPPATAADPLVAVPVAGGPPPARETRPGGIGHPGLHAVLAPLTGIFYHAPSPGAVPYVRVGGPVSAGQVIGLIEAMKLFNEIKSDITGTVRAMTAADGALVKAHQVLIEVEPS